MTAIRDMPPGTIWPSNWAGQHVINAATIVLTLMDHEGIIWVSDVYDALGPSNGQRTLDGLEAMGSLRILRKKIAYEAAELNLSAAGWA